MDLTLLQEFRRAMVRLEQAHGSPSAAAAACGQSRQSWRQWSDGVIPRLDTADAVIAASRALKRPRR